MALNDYTVALLTAIQNGTAYFVPGDPKGAVATLQRPVTDKNGVLGAGNIHFPGEEKYTTGVRGLEASMGMPVYRKSLSGKGANTLYDPNSGFTAARELFGGQEGSLLRLQNINIDTNSNKVTPSQNISSIVDIYGSGGPSGFSQLATTLFPVVANIALPGVGTAFSAINSIAQGADVGDVLKSVAVNQGLSALGSAAMSPEVDLNAATSDLQNVYGGNLPIEDVAAAFEPVVPEGVTVGSAIPTPDIGFTPLPTIEPSVVQPDYFSADAGPLADTTIDDAFVQDMSQGIEQPSPLAATDTAFLQDMDQGIQPEVNLEGGDLGMTEAEAQNQYYESIGIDPSTVTDTPAVSTTGDTPEIPSPEPIQETAKSLTPQQLYNLFKIGAGLFGGAGAISAVAKNITGGTSSNTPTSAILPTVKVPTPFTGTYSGMNPYDAAYFQQVQQNYNRLFPTAPTDVATPLQSWYQTQYKPDTTISNKLFGV